MTQRPQIERLRDLMMGTLNWPEWEFESWLEQKNLLLGGDSPLEKMAAGHGDEVTRLAIEMTGEPRLTV